MGTESFDELFDELAVEFEPPIEEDPRIAVIENNVDTERAVNKRKRKFPSRYADDIMDLKNTSLTPDKKIKRSTKRSIESLNISYGHRKRKSNNCRSCAGCLRPECEVCKNCLDRPKFGGKNTLKRKCELRACLSIT